MPEIYTDADAVRAYLTGASTDGGAQAAHNSSLGKNRSSTWVEFLAKSIGSPISNVTIDYASGALGLGAHDLEATGDDELTFTADGDSAGAAVTILNGETKVIESADKNKFVVVTRTSASALTGTAVITTTDNYNNVVGLDDVSSAEAAGGDTEYRCLCLKNVSAADVTVLKVYLKLLGTARAVDSSEYAASGAVVVGPKTGNFADWPATGFVFNKTTGEVMYYSSRTATALVVPAAGRDVWNDVAGGAAGSEDDVIQPIPGIRIGKEAPASQPSGAFTDKTGAGEGSAPGGVTFDHPTASGDADVINIGTLSAGYIYAVWIERKVIVGHVAAVSVLNHIRWDFDAV